MTIVDVWGAKGGVGTSVTAALLAIAAHGTLHSPVASLLGGRPVGQDVVSFGDSLVDVIDQGLLTEDHHPLDNGGCTSVLVTTSCYLALHRVISLDNLKGFSGIILVEEAGRALGAQDVTQVTGLPILATIPRDPSIARSVDAGLLSARPRTLDLSAVIGVAVAV